MQNQEPRRIDDTIFAGISSLLVTGSLVLSLTALAFIVGCGGSGWLLLQTDASSRDSSLAPKEKPELLYVANFSGNKEGSVTTYDLKTYDRNFRPVRTILQPQPLVLKFNQQGYLFVVTQFWYSKKKDVRFQIPGEPKTGFIGVYAPGSVKLQRTITKGMDGPRALAIDSKGNLYVVDSSNYGNYVDVYAAPKYNLIATLDKNTTGTSTLALDKQDNLYVANTSSVMVFAHDTLKLMRTITDGVECPNTLAFNSQDQLYVSNNTENCGNSVTIYASDTGKLLRTIVKGLHTPLGLAFDSAQNLYVGNNYWNTVAVYGPNGRLRQTIRKDLDYPDALLFDSHGRLYVASEQAGVAVFPPGSKTPALVIRNGVTDPSALALGYH
jgi:sugar lactone lactonase YvrE